MKTKPKKTQEASFFRCQFPEKRAKKLADFAPVGVSEIKKLP